MPWYFRVTELDNGRWACGFGGYEYDTHSELGQAVDHVATLAAEHRPAQVLLHRLDGSVDHLGPADDLRGRDDHLP